MIATIGLREPPLNFRYPIFLDLTGKRCLVIGEADELAGKIRTLRDCGAEVIHLRASNFKESDLEKCFLVIADLEDNSAIFRLCEERGILCNSVDDPGHCRFIFGSLHRRGDLSIAISTNGSAPALAVRLKEKFQREIGPEYQAFLEILSEVRAEIANRIPEFSARKALWYKIVDSELLDMLREEHRGKARQRLKEMIEAALRNTSDSGSRA